MKQLSSVIKTIVAVAAVVTVSKVIYDKVKENQEETDKDFVDISEDVTEDKPGPESSINSVAPNRLKFAVAVGTIAVIGIGYALIGDHKTSMPLDEYVSKVHQETNEKIDDILRDGYNEIVGLYANRAINNVSQEVE